MIMERKTRRLLGAVEETIIYLARKQPGRRFTVASAPKSAHVTVIALEWSLVPAPLGTMAGRSKRGDRRGKITQRSGQVVTQRGCAIS